MAEPAISVVVPTYNRATSLRRLLDALAACEPPPGGFEVIVVDDGSSDGTAGVVEGAGADVRYVRQENSGPATARNRGWQLARAPIIAFTDDDTVPDRRWLADLAEELAARPGLSGLGGNIEPLKGGFLADFVQLERLVGHGADEGGVRFLVTANASYRADVLLGIDGFDERFPTAAGEDTDLSFRVRRQGGALGVTPRATVLHDHRTSLRNLFRTYHRHGMARAQLARHHPDLGIGSAARSMMGPRYWARRFRYYRMGGAGPATALAYCCLRLAGLACYAAGAVKARRSS
jgi:glycosyltransferase involved in cell wall biosynthesis